MGVYIISIKLIIYLPVEFSNMYYYLSPNSKDYSIIQLKATVQMEANLHGSAE